MSTATIRSRCTRAAREAVERARAGEGPTLIEAMTFRFHGHVFGDADEYMDPAQKAAAIAADPYPPFRAKLIAERHRHRGAAGRDRGRTSKPRSTRRSRTRSPRRSRASKS